MSKFRFGRTSRRRLEGVHPDLRKVANLALELSVQDFSVYHGLRTDEQHEEFRRRGVTQVKRSKHQAQVDGYSHAIDCAPYLGGQIRFEREPQMRVADAFLRASVQSGVRVRWGGCWRILRDGDEVYDLVEAYAVSRARAGRRAFVDAWHFELA